MLKKSHTITVLGCFRYAQFVFVAEIFLAIYWIVVLTYASINDHEKLLAGLIFGLHYAGLIALSGLFDEVTKRSDAVHSTFKNETSWPSLGRSKHSKATVRVIKTRTFPSGDKENTNYNDLNAEELKDEADVLYEKKLIEKLDRYPLSYGVALFVAMISDFFSLVEAFLQHENHEIGTVTYYLYVVLFSVGLFLTLSSIVWSIVFYVKMKNLAKKLSTNANVNIGSVI